MVKSPPANAGGMGSIPGSGRSPGGGNGNPLQYSCLGNPMDRGAWWATAHGVTASWTQLSGWARTRTFYWDVWILFSFDSCQCQSSQVGWRGMICYGLACFLRVKCLYLDTEGLKGRLKMIKWCLAVWKGSWKRWILNCFSGCRVVRDRG